MCSVRSILIRQARARRTRSSERRTSSRAKTTGSRSRGMVAYGSIRRTRLIDGESSAGKWGAKLIEEYRSGRCTAAVLLVNAVTDAGWFQPLFDFPICFTDHRIEFYTPTGQPRSPVSGNAFVYFGDHVKDFARAFAELGRTMKAVES